MSEPSVENQDNAELPTTPEMLPPVEPPSAKFIVQLFVVPGLIVALIVGVWLLFGKLASAEQDWQALLADMKSSNEHRRGRATHGLATALSADQHRTDDGPRLATNPQVAQELSNFLRESLANPSQDKAVTAQQEYLARAVGLLDLPEIVFPVLREAMQPKHDLEVRKNAVLAAAMIADRSRNRGTVLSGKGIVDDITAVGRDDNPLLRSVAAATLGLFTYETTKQPLSVLLADTDANTRINAALGFARQSSLDGLPVLHAVLDEAATTSIAAPAGDASPVAVSNSLKAVGDLKDTIDADTRSELFKVIETISQKYPDARVRFDAAQTLSRLRGPSS